MKRVISVLSLTFWSFAASAQDAEQDQPVGADLTQADVASPTTGAQTPRLSLSSHKTVSKRSSEGTGLWQYWL
ncbi:MAG: hypothetical protein QGG40_15520, partial [Myxococcota bacterium]|nr:hypothetical protein [Myxococcota bacterium]